MLSHILKFLIFSILWHGASYGANMSIDDITIKSDRLTVNKKDGKVYFSGNVVAWFDEAILKTTDVIIVINDSSPKRKLERIIFPSKLTSMKESDDEVVVADSAEYEANSNLLKLKGNIYMQKGEYFVKCNELTYFAKIQTIGAAD